MCTPLLPPPYPSTNTPDLIRPPLFVCPSSSTPQLSTPSRQFSCAWAATPPAPDSTPVPPSRLTQLILLLLGPSLLPVPPACLFCSIPALFYMPLPVLPLQHAAPSQPPCPAPPSRWAAAAGRLCDNALGGKHAGEACWGETSMPGDGGWPPDWQCAELTGGWAITWAAGDGSAARRRASAAVALPLLRPHAPLLGRLDVVRHQVPGAAAFKVESVVGHQAHAEAARLGRPLQPAGKSDVLQPFELRGGRKEGGGRGGRGEGGREARGRAWLRPHERAGAAHKQQRVFIQHKLT